MFKRRIKLREREANPPSYIETLITDPITGIETAIPLPDGNIITVDSIPTQYQYLLEIDDHFN